MMLNILGGAQSDTHRIVEEKAESVFGARVHDYGKGDARPGHKMGHITLVADSVSTAEARTAPLIELVNKIRSDRMSPEPHSDTKFERAAQSNKATLDDLRDGEAPLVAVKMGSKSDNSVLAPGIDLLRGLGIPFYVTITSAHRTPEAVISFAIEAADKGDQSYHRRCWWRGSSTRHNCSFDASPCTGNSGPGERPGRSE